MKIHEYQAKQIFKRYGVAVPEGEPAFNVSEVGPIAERLIQKTQNPVVVVKAQIHAGGRGKGGGVKVAKGGAKEATELAEKILGMQLVTKQTGPEGQKVRRLYIEQGLDIGRELYLAMLVDRETRRVAIIASPAGGMDIEEVAEKEPEKLLTVHVDPLLGLAGYQARKIAKFLELSSNKDTQREFISLLGKLYAMFVAEDCAMAEINPLVVTTTGKVLALDGSIGCLVNGAGLAMATMDIIKHYGGEPANFLDVGGGANQEQVTQAFRIILKSDKVKGIFVNIFGGIMRCDVVANGIVAATKELGLKVPLVVRLEGTNVELGRKVLDESGLTIQSASSMGDGAQKIVAAIQG